MKVLILAGGFATRLWPLTEHRAKPLLLLGGKTILTRILEQVLNSESSKNKNIAAQDVIILTNKKFEQEIGRRRHYYCSRRKTRVFTRRPSPSRGGGD